MKDKYYIPSIDEFHFGFEYEEKDGNWKNETFNGYPSLTKHTFEDNHGDWYDSIEEFIEAKFVRVKYLDREDIESLGWEYKGDDKDGRNLSMYQINGYVLNDYTPYEYDDLKIYVSGVPANTLFNGIIKNKSELKRLMNQLGIEK